MINLFIDQLINLFYINTIMARKSPSDHAKDFQEYILDIFK